MQQEKVSHQTPFPLPPLTNAHILRSDIPFYWACSGSKIVYKGYAPVNCYHIGNSGSCDFCFVLVPFYKPYGYYYLPNEQLHIKKFIARFKLVFLVAEKNQGRFREFNQTSETYNVYNPNKQKYQLDSLLGCLKLTGIFNLFIPAE